jgi:hypothetical protein
MIFTRVKGQTRCLTDIIEAQTGRWRTGRRPPQQKKVSSNMSTQFFYVHLKFTPKIGTHPMPITRHHEAVVEVPKDLVQLRQSERVSKNSAEKAIALDLARRAALGTFLTLAERVLGLYDEDPPRWDEYRPHVMNERPCDYEENGTRAWRIV